MVRLTKGLPAQPRVSTQRSLQDHGGDDKGPNGDGFCDRRVLRLCDLSASELGESLLHSLNGLADVESKAQEFLRTQTEQDMVTLMGTGK